MTEGSALVATTISTGVLLAVHLLLPRMRARFSTSHEGIVAAVGGGIASAYVFLHLLPELARGNRDIAEVLEDTSHPSFVAELLLFIVAFAGFLLLYGLDHLAEGSEERDGSFAVHLAVYATYNALITYSLPLQFRAGTLVTALFVLAMAVHFLLSDRGLAEHYGDHFRRVGRPVLAAALVAGTALAIALAPTRASVVSFVLAALSGFVLYNVFSDELPSEQRVRYPVFVASAGAYAVLLLAITAATEAT